MQNVKVSIITVHYKAKESLFNCLESIYKATNGVSLEIIVVDNDEKKTVGKDLKKKFPKVHYTENENKGFGHGNNIGAKNAKGEYLFFLNPDTTVYPGAIQELVLYLKKYKRTGIVAPILVDKKGEPFALQGFSELTPKRAVFALSFINRIWPGNKFSKEYWQKDESKEKVRKVSVVPGTALMIRKDIFEKVGKFDENFFLYFEENDLCKRVRDAGYEVVMIPQAWVFHEWGVSTSRSDKNIKKIFSQSRFYYFKKHYGFLPALLVSSILKVNSQLIILLAIICMALFLRLFGLERNMTFIGDQGWFYVSARDMMVNGEIPLVGITSSRIWLHQGPIWTYMLGFALWIGNFNPLSGAYLAALLDVLAIVLLYKIGSKFFSQRFGIIAALLYTVSPALVANARMPYHTSPIPLLVCLLIYSILKWVRSGDMKFFPVVLFSMSMLYNFQLSTVVFWPVIVGLLLFGFRKKLSWATALKRKKIIILSLLGLLTPMIPVLMYDLHHGFRQTFWYAAWFVYKPLQSLGLFPKSGNEYTFGEVAVFFLEFVSELIFVPSVLVAVLLLFVSVVVVLKQIRSRLLSPIGIIFFAALVSVGGFFAAKTPSDAYLPMLMPALLLLFVYGFLELLKNKKALLFLIIAILVTGNVFHILGSIQSFGEFYERRKAAEKIISLADGRDYNLVGKGPGSEFVSFTMNYEYLTWWLGHAPASSKEELKIQVHEDGKHPEVRVTIVNKGR